MSGSRDAIGMLGGLGDPRAVESLKAGLTHADPKVRGAAAKGLGFSGSVDDVTSVIPLLRDVDSEVRIAASGTAAELGGRQAADAVAEIIPQTQGREQIAHLEALAWLNDPRAAGTLRALIPKMTGVEVNAGSYQGLPWALVRVGTPDDRLLLRQTIIDLARTALQDPDPAANWRAEVALTQYLNAVSPVAPEETAETLEMVLAVNPTAGQQG